MRCIVELLGAKQTRDLESMGLMVLWFGGMMVTSQGIKNRIGGQNDMAMESVESFKLEME